MHDLASIKTDVDLMDVHASAMRDSLKWAFATPRFTPAINPPTGLVASLLLSQRSPAAIHPPSSLPKNPAFLLFLEEL